MKKILLPFALFALTAIAAAQTATPTPTFTPSNTPTPTATRTPTPQDLNGGPITLTVFSGTTDSASLNLQESASQRCVVLVPGTIDGTASVRIAHTRATIATPYTVQQPTGTDVPLAAGKAVPLPELSAAQLWIHESSSAAADRVYVVMCKGVGQ